MVNFNMCEGCPKFEEQQDIILDKCDSVFDAAIEMHEFISECQKKCDRIEVIKDE